MMNKVGQQNAARSDNSRVHVVKTTSRCRRCVDLRVREEERGERAPQGDGRRVARVGGQREDARVGGGLCAVAVLEEKAAPGEDKPLRRPIVALEGHSAAWGSGRGGQRRCKKGGKDGGQESCRRQMISRETNWPVKKSRHAGSQIWFWPN